MRTSKQNPIREAVTPPLPVSKEACIGVQLQSRLVVDKWLPQLAPVIHRVINNDEDRRFVLAWYVFGKQHLKCRFTSQTLSTPGEQLSPLGQLCILALALGFLGYPLPEGIQSTSPPASNAA